MFLGTKFPKGWVSIICGEGGIRTLGNLAATRALQARALDQLCDLTKQYASTRVLAHKLPLMRPHQIQGIIPIILDFEL